LFQSTLQSLPLLSRGKVRDIYALDADHLLMIATDRLSAFDVILPDPIPQKGKVLTQLANFWFERLAAIVPGQLAGIDPESVVKRAEREQVRGRAIVVKRLTPLPVEAVVRGYLSGSGWKDYRETGAVCGVQLPEGLTQGARLPQPIFTPATKAAIGEHDENISAAAAGAHCAAHLSAALYGTGKNGAQLLEEARRIALRLYAEASAHAAQRGIIIADTKFEFGIDAAGTLHLIDEALTPDSSRFWPADAYRARMPGSAPPSFDKQFVRDYLETLDWNKKAPGPRLPAAIIARTAEKYCEAFVRLTGKPAGALD